MGLHYHCNTTTTQARDEQTELVSREAWQNWSCERVSEMRVGSTGREKEGLTT